MALVGTLSGSNGTSNTAVTGTLVVANTSTGFPRIPSDPADAVLYAQGSIVASNEIHASGNLRLLNSSGDEGGEIFLNKAVTNTTITNGVTIDVYQNKLRFFEQGGTARGYYIDITNGGAGVATNLAGSSSPGGSDTQVQFNDGGSFGGSADFKFAKSNGTLSVANAIVSGSGGLTSSGSLRVKDGSGNIVVSLSSAGIISGSSDLQIGGNAVVRGALEVTGGIRNLGPENCGFSGAFANFSFTSQSFVGVDTTLASYTGTLPVISGEYIGRLYNVKDVAGSCGTNAFVITASSPNKIDGATELKLSSTSGSVALVAGLSGSSYNWYIVSYT